MRRPGADALGLAADGIGTVSTLLGGVLVLAPRSGGARLGLDDDGARNRVLGAADLGLGVAIVAGRRASWRWAAVAARSALHLVFAREYHRRGHRRGAVGMCALFVVDSGVAAGLLLAERSRPAHHEQ